MHEASGWNSLGAELGDGVGKEEVTPQVCWYLVLGVDLLCGTLIGCIKAAVVWLLCRRGACAGFSFHPLETMNVCR